MCIISLKKNITTFYKTKKKLQKNEQCTHFVYSKACMHIRVVKETEYFFLLGALKTMLCFQTTLKYSLRV